VNTNSLNGKLQALKNKPAKRFVGKLLTNYNYFQSVIDCLVPESRRSTQSPQYCRAFNPDNILFTENGLVDFVNSKETYGHLPPRMGNKFQVVNVSPLESYGTVEFRQHGGSTNETKILNWIRIMERLVSRSWDRKYANRNCRDYNLTIDGFMDFLGFGQNQIRKYSRNRARNAGFNAISGVETSTVNTDNPNNRTNQESATSATSENSELRESLLVLENNYNSYHRIRNSVSQFFNDELSLIGLRNIIIDEMITHNLPTTVSIVDAVVVRFRELLTEE
jgi:hypothetical protein